MTSVESIPAATVVLARDAAGGVAVSGVEVLMLRRNSKIAFGGMWVFPGGRVDPGDLDSSDPDAELDAARRAAVREAQEEAGLVLDAGSLVTFSHWMPPAEAPRRFSTWFFLAPAPPGADVLIDGSEIHEHGWLTPADALARRDAGEVELAPPTWVTLWRLARASSVEAAIVEARDREPERYATRIGRVGDTMVAMWHGDAGHGDGDATRVGGRHRLWMLPDGWRFEFA